jgi:ABC-type sugar transport system substrate-binding protein
LIDMHERRTMMIRHRIAALTLALPLLLSVAATAQELLPGNPPVVLPPLGPEVRQAERDAARAAEQTARRKDEVRTPETEAGRENPGLDYDVTTGIQQRQLEQGLRR